MSLSRRPALRRISIEEFWVAAPCEPFPDFRQCRLNLGVTDSGVLESRGDGIAELLEPNVFGNQNQTPSNPQHGQRRSSIEPHRGAIFLG